jgi:hypothetical protein
VNRILKSVVLLAALALAAAGARAQTITAVTGTIADPNGIPYANGQVTITIAPPGVTSPFITATNSPILFPITASTNASGFFSVQLVANASITPAATQYTFRICAPVIPPPLGTGISCFTPGPVTIAGASQDLSTTFNPVMPKLLNAVGAFSQQILNFQGTLAATVGTGAAKTYYTFTLQPGTLTANQCLRITTAEGHSTGAATAQMTLSFGGTNTTNVGDDPTATGVAGSTGVTDMVYEICNNGSTSSQVIKTRITRGQAGTVFTRFDTAAVSEASPVVINLQFNVAATDQITPELFIAEQMP